MDGNVPLRPPDVAHFASAPQPVLTLLADRLLGWIERVHSRRILSRLDDRMLRDIGLDRATAHIEMRKPFWQA